MKKVYSLNEESSQMRCQSALEMIRKECGGTEIYLDELDDVINMISNLERVYTLEDYLDE